MTIKSWIQSAVTGLLVERPAQKMTLDEHVVQLQAAGEEISRKLAAAPDTPANRDKLCHVIGIERWAQGRLRVFLGEPLVDDDPDGYRPSSHLNWDALSATFRAARQETIELAQQIAAADPDPTLMVTHSQYGKLTAQGWLHYITTHASLEVKSIG